MTLDELLAGLDEDFRDLKLNLKAALRDVAVPPRTRWAAALAAALTGGHHELAEALRREGGDELGDAGAADARAAAALMAMTVVYYRSVHMLGKDSYERMPPKLRLQRMTKPATDRTLFETCALACAAVAGCERCLTAHEHVLRQADVTEAQVHDVVRLAAIVHGVGVSHALSRTATA